jgi:hypothetical protein
METPKINVTQTTKTIVETKIDPIILTAAQFDSIIAALKPLGISSTYPLTSANIQAVNVMQRQNGEFVVNIRPVQNA